MGARVRRQVNAKSSVGSYPLILPRWAGRPFPHGRILIHPSYPYINGRLPAYRQNLTLCFIFRQNPILCFIFGGLPVESPPDFVSLYARIWRQQVELDVLNSAIFVGVASLYKY